MYCRRARAYPNQIRGNSGFTLLELVIALLFSSVIVVIIASVLQLAIRSEEKGTRRQESAQHVRILVARLSFLLKGAYPYIVRTPEKQAYYFEGDSDSLSFITSSVSPREDSLVDKPGLKWVRIFADSEGLKLLETFFFLSDDYEGNASDERLLDESVTEIRFEYLDTGEEGKDDPEWQSEWSTEDREYLPAAIKVFVTILEREEELDLPPFTIKVQITKKKI